MPLILWISILAGLPKFILLLKHDNRERQEDFAVYYLEGEILKIGANPYFDDLKTVAHDGLDTHGITHGSDPPTFLILCRSLAALPIHSAYWIWQGFNFICLVLLLAFLFEGAGIGLNWALTFAGFGILYPPVMIHFWFAQSKLPLALLLLMTMGFMKHERPVFAGFSLAFAALLRIFPLGLAGYLILQRRWNVFGFMVLGLFAGASITAVSVGVSNSLSFFEALLFLTGNLWRRDISTYSSVLRCLLAIYPNSIAGVRLIGLGLILIFDVAILLATMYATLRMPAKRDSEWRVLSLWIAAVVLLQPVAWDYDLTLMLIPFGGLAVAAVHGKASRRAMAMAIVCYSLLLLWNTVAEPSTIVNPLAKVTLYSSGFLAMLAGYLSAYWFALDQPNASFSAASIRNSSLEGASSMDWGRRAG